ncbi:cobalt ABC transporter ATP-binding protein [candidate division LCP-89 bacterium B3_LCP]|uniref:Cobalt ABC transporter ATP-binding protein n=1 Tax=candidate division LCP-89 bacterium B3_LCP TaxID=2012998 RepID=A0A532UYQ0_UNCL8|nr:MAG: cobalt ABC transporter ATP-binding protein [candidate division LCP-89 bacterium B3_LCP]
MAAENILEVPALEVKNFAFRYSDGTEALADINFSVKAGEALAVIGPNGAGKSTLLLCLAGLLHGSGQVLIEGEEMTTDNERTLRRKLALVFQDPDDQLFMPTLDEDVAFGPANMGLNEEEVQARVKNALTLMRLWEKRKRPPHHLSFGEKRRAALATAIAQRARILLLDEPTSNLDPASRQELMDYLSAYTEARIIATHDLELARHVCSKCILISSGKQIASGDINGILTDKTLLNQHRLAAG